MPNIPLTPDHPMIGRTFIYRPDLPAFDFDDLDADDGGGVLVVAPGFKVRVLSAFTDWNAVPGLDMLYVLCLDTGEHTHVTPADLGHVGPLVADADAARAAAREASLAAYAAWQDRR